VGCFWLSFGFAIYLGIGLSLADSIWKKIKEENEQNNKKDNVFNYIGYYSTVLFWPHVIIISLVYCFLKGD